MSASEAAMIISTRERAVWTSQERKMLTRLSKAFNMHGDKLMLRCGNVTCPDDRIVLHAMPHAPHGGVLRCGCRDRVFTDAC